MVANANRIAAQEEETLAKAPSSPRKKRCMSFLRKKSLSSLAAFAPLRESLLLISAGREGGLPPDDADFAAAAGAVALGFGEGVDESVRPGGDVVALQDLQHRAVALAAFG